MVIAFSPSTAAQAKNANVISNHSARPMPGHQTHTRFPVKALREPIQAEKRGDRPWLRSGLLLGLLLASGGCMATDTNRVDAEGPAADVSGAWLARGKPYMVALAQQGARVTGQWQDRTPDNPMPDANILGGIRGRILEAKIGGHLNYFTVAPDGTRGKWSYIGEFYRFRVGASARDPRFVDEPLLRGGLVARYPVRPDGSVADSFDREFAKNPEREVLFFEQYRTDGEGQVTRTEAIVPIDPPRQAHAKEPNRADDPGLRMTVQGLRQFRDNVSLCKKQPGELDGTPCWWVMSPFWSEGQTELAPGIVMAELYRRDPGPDSLPVEVVEVARRAAGGSWQPVSSYLKSSQGLIYARAVIESGRVVRVETVKPERIDLASLIAGTDAGIGAARWRNRALLEAKVVGLTKFVTEQRTSDLVALVLQIEKAILDANHEGELLKDKAQRILESGAKEVEGLRELALAYRERIEILKPILAAVKEEVANRGR